MVEIIKFESKTKSINKQAIEILEDYLKQAKEGKIVDFAFTAITADGAAITEFTDTKNYPALLGALTLLQHDMMRDAHTEPLPDR